MQWSLCVVHFIESSILFIFPHLICHVLCVQIGENAVCLTRFAKFLFILPFFFICAFRDKRFINKLYILWSLYLQNKLPRGSLICVV